MAKFPELFGKALRPLIERGERVLRRDADERKQLSMAASPDASRRAREIAARLAPPPRPDEWAEAPGSVSMAHRSMGVDLAKLNAPAPPPVPQLAPDDTPAYLVQRQTEEQMKLYDPDVPASAEKQAATLDAVMSATAGKDQDWDDEDEGPAAGFEDSSEAAEKAESSEPPAGEPERDLSSPAAGETSDPESESERAMPAKDDLTDLVMEEDVLSIVAEEPVPTRVTNARRLLSSVMRQLAAKGEAGLPQAMDFLTKQFGPLTSSEIETMLARLQLDDKEEQIVGAIALTGLSQLDKTIAMVMGWRKDPTPPPSADGEEDAGSDAPSPGVATSVEPPVIELPDHGADEDEIEDRPDPIAMFAADADRDAAEETPALPDPAANQTSRPIPAAPARPAWASPIRRVDRSRQPSADLVDAWKAEPGLTRDLINVFCRRGATEPRDQFEAVRKRVRGITGIDIAVAEAGKLDEVVLSLHEADPDLFREVDTDIAAARGRLMAVAPFVMAADRLADWLFIVDAAAQQDFLDVTTPEEQRLAAEAVEHFELFVSHYGGGAADVVDRMKSAWRRRQRTLAEIERASGTQSRDRGLALFNASRLDGELKVAFDNFVQIARAFAALETLVAREVSRMRGKGQEDHALYSALQRLRAEGVARATGLRDFASSEGYGESRILDLLAAQGEGIRENYQTLVSSRAVVDRERLSEIDAREELAALKTTLASSDKARLEAEAAAAAAREALAGAERADSLRPFMNDFRQLMEQGATTNVHAMAGGSVVKDVRQGVAQLMIDVRERQVAFLFLHGNGMDDWTVQNGSLLVSDKLGATVDLGRVHGALTGSPSIDRARPIVLRVVICHGAVASGADIAIPFMALADRRSSLFAAVPADQIIESNGLKRAS